MNKANFAENRPDRALGARDEILLEVKDLKKYFPIKGGILSRTVAHVMAVDGVSFNLRRGETLGLVGESGCGKTTAGRAMLRLIEPTSGHVIFEGIDIVKLKKKELRPLRRQMQIIFQDPFASLNPRMTVGSIVGEPLEIHRIARGKRKEEMVAELLLKVGLSPDHMSRYPHEFSGGQRQRIGIARAIALKPKLVIGDEPVSSLDVSIQAQIINLLQDLQQEFALSYIVIAHNLSVIKHMCDRIAVMYLGKIVEIGATDEVVNHPKHPYTEALLSAVPVPDPRFKKERIILKGDVPSPIEPPPGCPFHPRCRYAQGKCKVDIPKLRELRPDHFASCHFPVGGDE